MAIVAVFMLPCLYLASLGPAFFLYSEGYIEGQTVYLVVIPFKRSRSFVGCRPEWFWESHAEYIDWWKRLAK